MCVETIKTFLETYPHLQIAYVFGSAAKGRLRSDSDIDIAVAACEPLSVNVRLDLITALSKITGREIDLIDLKTTHGLLLHEIMTTGMLLFCKDTHLKYGFARETVYFAEDFLPQVRDFCDRKVRRFING